jgi:hypothetical protein
MHFHVAWPSPRVSRVARARPVPALVAAGRCRCSLRALRLEQGKAPFMILEAVAVEPLLAQEIANLTHGIRHGHQLRGQTHRIFGLAPFEPIEPLVRHVEPPAQLFACGPQLIADLLEEVRGQVAAAIAFSRRHPRTVARAGVPVIRRQRPCMGYLTTGSELLGRWAVTTAKPRWKLLTCRPVVSLAFRALELAGVPPPVGAARAAVVTATAALVTRRVRARSP